MGPSDSIQRKNAVQKKSKKVVRKRTRAAVNGNVKSNKQTQMIELLKRPDGATLNELMSASGWQAHSVRGFLSGAVSKRLGLPVDSTKRDDGQRVYRVV
jgi:hypothetical protein